MSTEEQSLAKVEGANGEMVSYAKNEKLDPALLKAMRGDKAEKLDLKDLTFPVISISKDNGLFTIGSQKTPVEEVFGHVLLIQKFRVYYEGKYDPNDPQPPLCRSTFGMEPDETMEDPQSDLCSTCEQAKQNDIAGAPLCQERIWIYFLKHGDAIPYIINLSPTNNSKKCGPKGVLQAKADLINWAKDNFDTLEFCFTPVKLTTARATFKNGDSSVLQVEVDQREESIPDNEKGVHLFHAVQAAEADYAKDFEGLLSEGAIADNDHLKQGGEDRSSAPPPADMEDMGDGDEEL